MLTKKALVAMDERALRQEILVPLFSAMGFRDVTLYHGGVLEQGKDIVMWKEGILGQREYYAVVAKSASITGGVSGKNSFTEVTTQVAQAFGSPYVDPNDGMPRHVKECFVVFSRRLTKEAMTAVTSALAAQPYHDRIHIVGHDRLWELVQQHIPRAAWEKLEQAKEALRRLAPPGFNLSASIGTEGTSIQFGVDPSHPPQIEDLTIRGTFVFPSSDEGLLARSEFERAIKTGEACTLDGKYIKEMEVSEALSVVFGGMGKPAELRMEPIVESRIYQFEIEFEAGDGQVATLGVLDMRRVRKGTEQATLSNEGQDIPWAVNLTIAWLAKKLSFNWKLNLVGASVVQALRALRFSGAVSKGGNVRIKDHRTGLRLTDSAVSPGACEAPPTSLLAVLEDAALIQERLNVLLPMPEHGFSPHDLQVIGEVAHAIREPRYEVAGSVISATVRADGVPQMLEEFGAGRTHPLRLEQTMATSVLGATVELGQVIVSCPKGRLRAADVKKLQARAASKRRSKRPLVIHFENEPGTMWTVEHPKWIAE